MTALNLVTQPGASWIINDTAYYDDKGVIQFFASKTVFLAGATAEPAAVALSGGASIGDFAAVIEPMNIASATTLLDRLPEIHRGVIDHATARGCDIKRHGALIGVASFNRRTGAAAAHMIGDDPNDGGLGSDYVPGTVVGGWGHYCTFDWRRMYGDGADLNDPAVFHPIRDAPAILDAQRRRPGEPFPKVGGEGRVTRVSARGVETVSICRWADKVGATPDPDRSPLMPMTA